MPASTGDTISSQTRRLISGVIERARRECSHASSIRPPVIIEDPLVILSRTKRHEARPVGEDEVRRFLSDEKLFEHDPIARVTEPAIDHHRAHHGFSSRSILGNDDTLARREAVGLQDQRIRELAATNRLQRGRGRIADAKRGSRDTMPRHEILRERLAPFEGGGGPGRTDDRAARGGEHIDDAAAQWHFGTDHRQIDSLTLCNRQ